MFLPTNTTFQRENLLFCKTLLRLEMNKGTKNTIFTRLMDRLRQIPPKAMQWWDYCSNGVWNDTRSNWKVDTIKTINLSVRSFMNTKLQNQAASLTYSTLLAVVPALAILFAIGRGFGFQNLLTSQLFNSLPSQKKALETAIGFVDQYLAQASQGVFVGVGLVVLLWTLISLMSNIENTFNLIWGVTSDRSMARKVIDYTAILFLLPILMICSSGLSLVASTTILDNSIFRIFSPALKILLDFTPFFLSWISFTGMYMLFPNTKVKFKYALLSGILAGSGFQILQYLFVSGQLYVSKYNAIYGSFAFLPLLLLWMQLAWTITLAGVVLSYSSQNIFQFNFEGDINTISPDYKRKISIVIMAIIVQRFSKQYPPLRVQDFAALYHMPARLVNDVIKELVDARLLSEVYLGKNNEELAYQPAVDIHLLSIGYVLKKIDNAGSTQFIPNFKDEFAPLLDIMDQVSKTAIKERSSILLMDVPVNIEGTPDPTLASGNIIIKPNS